MSNTSRTENWHDPFTPFAGTVSVDDLVVNNDATINGEIKSSEATFGGAVNKSSFGPDGTFILAGDATTFDDLSMPAISTKIGANNKPDYDFTNLGLLFPENNESEKVYITQQMSHKKLLDTPIYFHIHYIQESVDQPIFVAEYRFYNNGEAVSGSWTTIKTSDLTGNKGVFVYSGGSLSQIGTFPLISPPVNEKVSANIDLVIYRETGDGLSGDVLVKFLDCHIQIDSFGSSQQYLK